jgi:hypothetical protein
MASGMTKRRWMWALAAIALAAAGCKDKSACDVEQAKVEISGNHGHSIEIKGSAIRRGIGGTYPVRGGNHEHVFALKDADMKALNAGEKVTTRASSVNGHTHEIVVHCQ